MENNSTHLTDGEIGILGQVYWDELRKIFALKQDKKFSVKSFFLKNTRFKRAETAEEMQACISQHLETMLPPKVIKQAPSNLAYQLQCMRVFHYIQGDQTVIVMSRMNDANSLQQRVAVRSGVSLENVDIPPTQDVSAYDNFSLTARLFTYIRQVASDEFSEDRSDEDYYCCSNQYFATQSARARLASYGDIKTLDLHESVTHIKAFTQGILPYSYMGGVVDGVSCTAHDVAMVYKGLTEQLLEAGYAHKNQQGRLTVSAGGLLVGLGEIFEQHEGHFGDEGEERFSSFYKSLTEDQLNKDALQFIKSLDAKEFIECQKQFVLFQTLKGLRHVMGKNAKRFVPERDAALFNHVTQRIQLALA